MIIMPKEFVASGVASGVKKNRPDLGMIFSKKKAACVGFFTSNKVKAAPVLLSKSRLNNSFHRAVIINSGSANCLTGKAGLLDAKVITKKVASLLGVGKSEVLMCSTGIIGKRLSVKKITSSLPLLVRSLSKNGLHNFSKAIITTDTHPKIIGFSFKVGKRQVTVAGVAKGAGMIAPNMATMLCVIFTDADINKGALKKAANSALDNSFNCITVDGDMSTNDTLLCFANGASGVKIKPNTTTYKKFAACLSSVALNLAKMIVKDGEGATKFVQINITSAKTIKQAKRVAFGIANSNLVKTAVYGNDPNIGRVASACGAADKDIQQERLDIYFNGKKTVKNGIAQSARDLRDIFKKKEINIHCDLKLGKASYKVFTCDLSPEYVKINAEYN